MAHCELRPWISSANFETQVAERFGSATSTHSLSKESACLSFNDHAEFAQFRAYLQL